MEKASNNILAFIHFSSKIHTHISVVQGIKKNEELLKIRKEDINSFLVALGQDKAQISKCLLKSLYWALTLPQSKLLQLLTLQMRWC